MSWAFTKYQPHGDKDTIRCSGPKRSESTMKRFLLAFTGPAHPTMYLRAIPKRIEKRTEITLKNSKVKWSAKLWCLPLSAMNRIFQSRTEQTGDPCIWRISEFTVCIGSPGVMRPHTAGRPSQAFPGPSCRPIEFPHGADAAGWAGSTLWQPSF